MSLKSSFLGICLAFCFYLMAILACSIFGWFYFWPILVLSVMFGLTALVLIILGLKKASLKKLPYLIILAVVIFVFIIGFFHHELPTGRDTLSFIIGADRLAKFHSLKWDDFFTRPITGVINITGNEYLSQFLPVYISYLGVFYLFGGMSLLFWANVLLILLSLIVVYFLCKALANKKASIIAIIFFITSYLFYWFPKRTNVENVHLFLIWFGIWLLVEALNRKKALYLFLSLIPFSILPLTRPDGFIFFAWFVVVFLIVLFKYLRKDFKKYNLAVLLLSVFNIALFFCYSYIYEPLYIIRHFFSFFEKFSSIIKVWYTAAFLGLLVVVILALWFFLRKFKKINYQKLLFYIIVIGLILFEGLVLALVLTNHLVWNAYRTQYVLESFTFYFLFVFFLIIVYGLKKQLFNNKEFWLVVAILPVFAFIIEPFIGLDQPWYMRRFFSQLVPMLFILAAIALSRLEIDKKKLRYFVLLIACVNLALAAPVIFLVDHQGYRDQIAEFNKKFEPNSLIVMDTGSSWWNRLPMVQHYFYDLDALNNINLYEDYEFTQDLPELLEKYPNWQTNDADLLAILNWKREKSEAYFKDLVKKYQNVYVISDERASNIFASFKDENFERVGEYTFSFPESKRECMLIGYVRAVKNLDINYIRECQANLPPSQEETVEATLYIYRVINPDDFICLRYITKDAEVPAESECKLVKKGGLGDNRNDLEVDIRKLELEKKYRSFISGLR